LYKLVLIYYNYSTTRRKKQIELAIQRKKNNKKEGKNRNRNKNKTYKQTNNAMYIQPKEVSSPADLPTVPRTAATFPCSTATDICWRRYSSDLGSSVTCLRCWLRSWMKERASGPNTPEVSTAT